MPLDLLIGLLILFAPVFIGIILNILLIWDLNHELSGHNRNRRAAQDHHR